MCVSRLGRVFILAGALLLGSQMVCLANEVEIVAEGSYTMGDSESAANAKKQARTEAMRMAAEKAGVYVRSYTEVKDLQLAADEIKTIAGSLLKIVEQKCEAKPLGDTVQYVVTLKALVNTDGLDDLIKKETESEKASENDKRYKELEERYNQLDKDLSRLKQQQSGAHDDKAVLEDDKRYIDLEKRYNKLNDELAKLKSQDAAKQVDNLEKIQEENKYYKELEERYNKLNEDLTNLKQHMPAVLNFGALPNRKAYIPATNEKVINLSPVMESAKNMIEANDYEKAINNLLAAKNAGVQDPNLDRLLGMAYYRNEQYFEALLCYSDAVQIVTDDGQLYKEYGDALYTRGRYKDALKAYDKALALDGSLYAAHANRGATLWVMGRTEEAIEEYGKANRINSQDGKLKYANSLVARSYFRQNGSIGLRNPVKILPLV